MNDYPGTLQIETTGACVGKCGFCPHEAMGAEQQRGRMEHALWEKLAREVAGWPVVPTLVPLLTGDPFADPRLPEWLEEWNRLIPMGPITLFTLGTLFSPATLQRWEGVRNVDQVFISLHHSDPLAYASDIGGDHTRACRSIRRFLEWNDRCWGVPVTLLRVQDGNEAADQAFVAFCEKEFPEAKASLSYRYNWAGEIESPWKAADNQDIICPRHTSMCVRYDGTVALCCLDARGEYPLGDVASQTLLEVYSGPMALAYRTRPKRANVPCRACNMA